MRGLTEQQWRSIKNIINENTGKETVEKLSGKPSFTSWIMDIGASHHLTRIFDFLTIFRDMDPVLIVVADGREQVSLKKEKIYLGADLVMKSVYYVEDSKLYLISVGQLMDENNVLFRWLITRCSEPHFEDADWSG